MLKSEKKRKNGGGISGTREWADFNVNCISGCSNNCRYCYAKMMAKRFGRETEQSWNVMKINQTNVEKNFGKKQGRIMFPTSHDLTDDPKVQNACLSVLSNLLKNGNDVLVTTKPRFKVIKKIISTLDYYRDAIQFRFTITSLNNNLLKFWEPNAPTFEERFESLRYAFNKKFQTSVSIEPFLDYDPELLVRKIEPYCTESIWIGKMNYIKRNNLSDFEQLFYDNVRKNYQLEHLEEIFLNLKDNPKIRFKDNFGILH